MIIRRNARSKRPKELASGANEAPKAKCEPAVQSERDAQGDIHTVALSTAWSSISMNA